MTIEKKCNERNPVGFMDGELLVNDMFEIRIRIASFYDQDSLNYNTHIYLNDN